MTFRRREPQSESFGSGSSDGDLHKDAEKQDQHEGKITLKQRIKHFTWAWFTLTMSTGGFATLLSVQPHKFHGLSTIGTIVYIFDLVLFVCLVATMIARFIIHPGSLRRSFTNTHEAMFFATFWLSLPTIIGGMNNYGAANVGEWLIVVLRVLFWIYCACTICVAACFYWFLFTLKQLTLETMTPGWILPIFPVMLTGTLASILAKNQPPASAMTMIVAGVTTQGLGWTVATFIYAIMILRLMTCGLPAVKARPAMFICVGPPAFTALALIGMSTSLPENYGYFAENPGSTTVLKTMALFISIFIWSISFWWFCIAVFTVLAGAKEMVFALNWWAMVFPNVGFTISVIQIGNQLKSQGIQWVGSIMTILIFAMWLFVLVNHAYAVLTKRIMMPGKDEDKAALDAEEKERHEREERERDESASQGLALGDKEGRRSRH